MTQDIQNNAVVARLAQYLSAFYTDFSSRQESYDKYIGLLQDMCDSLDLPLIEASRTIHNYIGREL